MNLLIIRHAIAEDKDAFAETGQNDDLRPLTEEGRTKMMRGAEGLRTVVKEISLLATSPLVRARETAEIVANAYGISIAETTDALRPDAAFEDFLTWLEPHSRQTLVAVVGHEPHLSGLATWLLFGDQESRIDLKKGAACLLSLDKKRRRGGATLRWALTPGQMRSMAR